MVNASIREYCMLIVVMLLIRTINSMLSRNSTMLLARVPWSYQYHDIPSSGADMAYFNSLGEASIITSEMQTKAGKKQERIEYLCMEKTQRNCVHNSILAMKSVKVGKYNEYDIFVLFHDGEKSPSAHNGPSFILWHRFYIYMFELAMGRYFRSCTLPYWDNRLLARSGPNPRHSVLFTPELFGEAYGEVRSGFAAGFKTINSTSCQEISKILTRAVPSRVEGLFEDIFASYVSSAKHYKELCSPWNETFEMIHGDVHMFIGQLMAYLSCAPSDPLFFLHHCFVDYMYEKHFRSSFKEKFPEINLTYPEIFERDDLEDIYAGDAIMMPFGILHEDMLADDNFIPSYSKSPGDVECLKDEDCCANKNTEYIWCHTTTRRCIAKIQEKGKVLSGFPNKACYCKSPKNPVIEWGFCKCL